MQMTGQDFCSFKRGRYIGRRQQYDRCQPGNRPVRTSARLQIGLSRDFEFMDQHRLTIAVDAVHPNDNSQWVDVGGELSLFNNLFSLRGGYKALFLPDTQEGLTLGVGINYGGMKYFKISVDYSYQRMKYLDNLHSFWNNIELLINRYIV